MRVIQAQAEIGEDRVLQVRLPKDVPPGRVDVVVILETPARRAMSPEEREVVAEAGLGALKGVGPSVDEFLAERRERQFGK